MGNSNTMLPGRLITHDDGRSTFRLDTSESGAIEINGVGLTLIEGIVEFDKNADGVFMEVPVAEVKMENPDGEAYLSLRIAVSQDIPVVGTLTLKDLIYSYDDDLHIADFELTPLS